MAELFTVPLIVAASAAPEADTKQNDVKTDNSNTGRQDRRKDERAKRRDDGMGNQELRERTKPRNC